MRRLAGFTFALFRNGEPSTIPAEGIEYTRPWNGGA
jgi:hypothetical protein